MPYSWPPTLAEAQAELNMTVGANTELQGVLDAAVAILENHPGYRVTDAVKATAYTEDWTRGGSTILLGHYPVTAVTSVTEYVNGVGTVLAAEPITTALFTAYGYRLSATSGILTRLSGGYATPWLGTVRVVYTAGTSTVPADIRAAALKLVKHLWRDQRGTGAGRAIPGESPEDAYLADVSPHLLPLDVEQALAPYKRTPAVA